MAPLQLPVNAPKDTEVGEPGESMQAELRLNALGCRFCIIIPWRGFPMWQCPHGFGCHWV